nr:carboxypeptidase regulatory-like domain-containing protein [Acinetobacter sp. YH01026]
MFFRDQSDITFALNSGLSIKGRVKEAGLSIPCRIRLYEKLSGRFCAETVTDMHGNYEFNHLTAVKFFIVAHHPASRFNAVIQDNVVPK